ncbi:winged helix-turn-helix transcriptional regulator [Pararhizobium sp. DWP3-4]|uniref:winged helix-turn-helix transcriptional regulator n=1 Tax=Pararhizobium sp. DWP3-4 TaxID=2804565 RepID=UPI003CEE2A9E
MASVSCYLIPIKTIVVAPYSVQLRLPPHVEYELTDFGHSLARVLAPLREWGTRHSSEVAIIVQNRRRASEAA